MTLLYDADCGLCVRAVRRGRRALRGVEVRPMQSVDLARLGVDPARTRTEIPFVYDDGAVVYGADAIAAALRAGRAPWRWLGRVMSTRPVRPVTHRVYRWVERRRHRPGPAGH